MPRSRILLEVPVAEVVQHLGEHDEVEGPRPVPGDIAPVDADMRHIPGAPLRGPDRGRRDVAGQQAVAAPGEHLGQHADGAAGLEGAAIPPRRELREADRVLAPLIPAVLESPRVRRGLVHRVEVARPQRTGGYRSGHRSSTSWSLVKCATIPGGSTGPSGGPAAGQLAGEGLDGRTLPGRDAGGQRYPARARPGDARVSRLGPVPHPDRVAQYGPAVRRGRPPGRAARGLVIGVRILLPRREADVETGAQLAQAAGRARPRERPPRCRGAAAGPLRRPGHRAGREQPRTPRSWSARSRQDRNPDARPRRR